MNNKQIILSMLLFISIVFMITTVVTFELSTLPKSNAVHIDENIEKIRILEDRILVLETQLDCKT